MLYVAIGSILRTVSNDLFLFEQISPPRIIIASSFIIVKLNKFILNRFKDTIVMID